MTDQQIQMAYAHRYVLQMVIYRMITAALRWAGFALLILMGIAAGVAVAIAVVLAFYSALDWVMQVFFSTGFLRF